MSETEVPYNKKLMLFNTSVEALKRSETTRKKISCLRYFCAYPIDKYLLSKSIKENREKKYLADFHVALIFKGKHQ